MRISKTNPLVFVHIPKTGGMSLFSAFAELWGEEIADLYDISSTNEEEALRLLSDIEKQLYCGHFSFGLHQWMNRPSYYVSVLREPISRLVSLYHYCQPMLETYEKRLIKAGGSMVELALQPRISDFYLDFEPCLRGDRSPEAFFSSTSAELDNAMVRRFSGYGLNPAKCPESALEQAKINIKHHFSFVGLLERYEETLQALSKMFDLPGLTKNHVNKNKRKKETPAAFDEKLLKKIEETNALDIQLYDWITERFDQMLTKQHDPILVPGEQAKRPVQALWRAVGQSPIREATMKARGIPQVRKQEPVLALSGEAKAIHMNETAIFVDVEIRPYIDGKLGSQIVLNRLILRPSSAKKLSRQLAEAVESYEEKFIKIKI